MRDRLRKAVSDLVRPVEYRSPEGAVGINDSLLDQLDQAVWHGLGKYGGRRAERPVPISVSAVDLQREIESKWRERGKSLKQSIADLPGQIGSSGDDVRLELACEALEGIATAIRDLFNPPVRLSLSIPCPECGNTTAYKLQGDEYVRTPAVVVGTNGGMCMECGAGWTVHGLAALLV